MNKPQHHVGTIALIQPWEYSVSSITDVDLMNSAKGKGSFLLVLERAGLLGWELTWIIERAIARQRLYFLIFKRPLFSATHKHDVLPQEEVL